MNTLKTMVARKRNDEQGFTLIELMVVVLIIAILIAIAIPTFLGARERSQDRAAQSDLRNALTAEKTVYTDSQSYNDDAADMLEVESSLDWDGALKVYVGDAVTPDDKGVVCLETTSKSGTTFWIGDIAGGPSAGTFYGKTGCGGSATVAAVSAGDSSW